MIMRLATSLETFCNAPAADPQMAQSEDLHGSRPVVLHIAFKQQVQHLHQAAQNSELGTAVANQPNNSAVLLIQIQINTSMDHRQ